jgi:serine/threonine protein kinase
VYKAKCIQTGASRAIKKLNRKKNSKVEQIVMSEYDILKEMDHPNILKIF